MNQKWPNFEKQIRRPSNKRPTNPSGCQMMNLRNNKKTTAYEMSK